MIRHRTVVLWAPLNAFAISVAFWPGIAGPATSPRWAIGALSLYHLHWACTPFLVWCCLRLDFDSAVHWAIICAAFSWGLKSERVEAFRIRNGRNWSRAFGQHPVDWVTSAFAIGIAISGIIAIGQVTFDWQLVPQVIKPAGLFLNKNFMGEAACLAFIAAISNRLWLSALIVAPALVLSGSRASWLATTVALFFLVNTRQKVGLVVVAALVGAALWHYGFGYTYTLDQRLMLWSGALHDLSFLGNGSYDFSTVENREPNLHNDWLQLIYELGIIGLVPILTVAAAASPFVVALVVIGSFGFPFHMPASAWFAAFVVGNLVGRNAHERRVVLRPRMANAQL